MNSFSSCMFFKLLNLFECSFELNFCYTIESLKSFCRLTWRWSVLFWKYLKEELWIQKPVMPSGRRCTIHFWWNFPLCCTFHSANLSFTFWNVEVIQCCYLYMYYIHSFISLVFHWNTVEVSIKFLHISMSNFQIKKDGRLNALV